jgi:hypothetical protein
MRIVALLFGAAAVPRILYLLLFDPHFEGQYWALSDSLVRTGTFTIDEVPITDFEPLYPTFLAIARLLVGPSVVAVQLVQIACASLGAVLLFQLTSTLTGSRRPALIAALLFAANPLLIRHASSLTDSSLTTVLLVGFAAASAARYGTRGAVLPAVWLGLAVLSRMTVLPIVILMAAIHTWRGQVRDAAVVAVIVALMVVPWMVRNHRANGAWWPTRSGLNLYIGNSPYTAALLPDHDLDLLEPVAYDQASVARPDLSPDSAEYASQIDTYLSTVSIAHMIESPVATVTQKLENMLFFVSPYLIPHYVTGPDTRVRIEPPDSAIVEDFVVRPRLQILSHAFSSSVVLVAAAAGVYLRRGKLAADAVLWAVFLSFVFVHAMYFPATRYRAPMEFVLFHYAGVAMANLDVRRVWNHGRGRER